MESCVTIFAIKMHATSVLAICFHRGLKPMAQNISPRIGLSCDKNFAVSAVKETQNS